MFSMTWALRSDDVRALVKLQATTLMPDPFSGINRGVGSSLGVLDTAGWEAAMMI